MYNLTDIFYKLIWQIRDMDQTTFFNSYINKTSKIGNIIYNTGK